MKIVIALIMLFSSISKATDYSVDIEGPKKGIYVITVWKGEKSIVFEVDQKLYDNDPDSMVRDIALKVKNNEKL